MSGHGSPGLVWYASYGSNLSFVRFSAYLQGGVAPGSTRVHVGARDPSPPLAVAPHVLAHRRFYAGVSRTWGGGGVAFVDPEPSATAATPARRYLVTVEQFHDVLAQESGRPVGAEIDLGPLEPGTTRILGPGAYDRLLVTGLVDDVPVVTFTTPADPATLDPNPPSEAYLATIVAGLVEAHGFDEDTARRVALSG